MPIACTDVQHAPRFDAFVMVDWSAASSPGREGGQPNGIWVATGAPGRPDEVRPFRTRADATAWLIATCARLADEGRRVLLGVDFSFGYPAGTAAALGAPPRATPWRWMWDLLALEVADDAANDNDRFSAASDLNARMDAGSGPFWGHPPTRLHADLAPTKGAYPVSVRGRSELAEFRRTELALRERGHHPKSVWQLSGAGAVGSQSLLGIPRLRQIRRAASLSTRCTVWPLETGFADPLEGLEGGRVVVAEVYPSMIEPAEGSHPVRDAAQVLALVAAYRAMADSGALAAAFAGPTASGADVASLVDEEGWILDVVAPVLEPEEARGLWDWEAEDVVNRDEGADGGGGPGPDAPRRAQRGRLRSAGEAPEEGESSADLARVGSARIVEILSSATPDRTPYDQAEDEWVVVLEGRAELEVDGEHVDLEAGDWLLLPARTAHRVLSTAPGTRWLAVHGR
ncbi:hypothetical protein BH23ACT9_BH23ACT9_20450 [soil metagenome]